MPRRSTDSEAWRLFRQGLDAGLRDVGQGRLALREAAALFEAQGPPRGRLLCASALVVLIEIADDDYTGFEESAAVVAATQALIDGLDDPAHRLLARAAALVAGWFAALDHEGLSAQAELIVRDLGDAVIDPPLRCCAGLVALAFYRTRMELEGVLYVALALRPLLSDPQDAGYGVVPPRGSRPLGAARRGLADPAIGARLADEAHHLLVQSLYECGAPARAADLRAQREASGRPMLPVIELKLLLLDAQIALGAGAADAGGVALARAEPLLDPRAPRPASWWHLLRSRLDLLEDRHREALVHARLALRLGTASRLPERWMGVTVMQEGQVLMAAGDPAAAVPFFERAGREASGSQAEFCWCLAHLARALHHLGAGEVAAGRAELGAGLALARGLAWFNFFRAGPRVAAAVCAAALEHDIEATFVREVIAARALQAVRPDLAAWPWPIRVRTLGRFQIELDGAPLAFAGRAARKPLELLQFVIASGGSDISATTVMFALWRELEGDKARSAFNVALHRLRKLLANDDAIVLELGRLSLNPKLVWVDCLAFEQLVDGAGVGPAGTLSAQAAQAAQRAVAMYSGHFLNDTEDEPWQMVYCSRLASKFKRCVGQLARHGLAHGDMRSVRTLLERALELDPMAEDLARDLMRLLCDAGEQAAALDVYARCRSAIASGLAAKPAAATLQLVERIRAM